MTSDLGMAATRIRDARMAIEAKRAEIASDNNGSDAGDVTP